MMELKSNFISIDINPDRGGVISSIRSHRTNDEWIYFDPSRRTDDDSLIDYDDVWCGGFEELFPNDAAQVVNGRSLKDHGELWQQQWKVIRASEDGITIEARCHTVPASVQKEILLDPNKPEVIITYSLQNKDDISYPYMFKLHPAMRIEQGDEILLSNGKCIPVDLDFSRIISRVNEFDWPMTVLNDGKTVDLSIIPPKELGLQEFIYVKEILKGECGLQRKRTGEKFILKYPADVFPFCWFFMALGGWRNHYTVVMEPCTNFPKDMNTAVNHGSCAIMGPRELRKFSISISLV